MVPLLSSSITSWGCFPSTVHPTLWAVPRTSLQVPFSSRAIDLGRIVRAIAKMSSKEMFPLCLTAKENQISSILKYLVSIFTRIKLANLIHKLYKKKYFLHIH